MGIRVSTRILEKLARKHNVKKEEVDQCFANRNGKYLRDPRAEHQTNPPTQWFIAETDFGRRLKVVFIRNGSDVDIKSAFDPNQEELRIYAKFGGGTI
jgi:uncharacterized DUF497 family protein